MIDRDTSRYVGVFENVRALFLVVQEAQQEHGLPLRRAALRSNGEVTAEAVDFLADVQIKAKRALYPVEYDMFMKGLELPLATKVVLGQVFLRTRLNASGDYRQLFFQIKKVMDGQSLSSVEYGKAADPTPTLEEYDRRTA